MGERKSFAPSEKRQVGGKRPEFISARTFYSRTGRKVRGAEKEKKKGGGPRLIE